MNNILQNIKLQDIRAEKYRRSFYLFVQDFWTSCDTSIPVWNWHIKYLCDTLQSDVYRLLRKEKKDKDIIINCPPGVSKSMIVSVMLPAWIWTIDPKIKIISASCSSSVATELAVKSRNLILSDRYQYYFHLKLKADENNKTNYKTEKGGYRYVTSTGSNILGMHGDLILVDDIQNLDTVISESERKNTNDWITGTLFTRKTDKDRSLMVYVQQRLHELDVSSFLISNNPESYKQILLPAELSDGILPIPNELSNYYIDNVLDITRLSKKTLVDIKKQMGTRNYQAQFLQNPSDKSQSIIKDEWINMVNDQLLLQNLYKLPLRIYIDTAYGEKNSDYSAILTSVVFNNTLYILDCKRYNLQFPELIEKIKEITLNRNVLYICIEGKASGKSIIQQLRVSTRLNVIEINPKDSKIVRLNAIAPVVESRRVSIIDGSWNKEFIDEVCSNNPTHDDMRDVFTYAVDKELKTSKSSIKLA